MRWLGIPLDASEYTPLRCAAKAKSKDTCFHWDTQRRLEQDRFLDSVNLAKNRLQKCFQDIFPTRPISSCASADSFGIYGTYPTHLPVASLLFRCA
jgi:hypothetical protein